MLTDPAGPDSLREAAGEALFEPGHWSARGGLAAVSGGRGAAWFIEDGMERWVLRHYLRGGSVARMLGDRYVWAGEDRVRSFVEFRLLAELLDRGLPVPAPVAARYRRSGLIYRCDLITRRIGDARPLSAILAADALRDESWRAVGATLARLHRGRVDHADLNAHNVLIGSRGEISVIDFDRCRLRPAAAGGPGERCEWTAGNLRRLRRSLEKIARGLPPGRFSPQAWRSLLDGYAAFGAGA